MVRFAVLAGLIWVAATTAMLRTTVGSLQRYERTLQPYVQLPTDRADLQPYEADVQTFEARRGLMTRLWTLWVLATFLPLMVMLAVILWASQEKSPQKGPSAVRSRGLTTNR